MKIVGVVGRNLEIARTPQSACEYPGASNLKAYEHIRHNQIVDQNSNLVCLKKRRVMRRGQDGAQHETYMSKLVLG